jgi:hypothetical protein
MGYSAKVLEIMIASPGDTMDERNIAREVLANWNDIYARDRELVLLGTGWDTHSSPDLSGRAQGIINVRVLEHADLVIGIFKFRLGTPTGEAPSGTVEEIQKHHNAGKAVMLYFSNEDIPRTVADDPNNQLHELNKFRKWAEEKGIICTYKSLTEFRDLLKNHLPLTLRDNPYLRDQTGADFDFAAHFENALNTTQTKPSIPEKAYELLTAAASDNGILFIKRLINSTIVKAGRHQFGDAKNKREMAVWEEAINQLSKLSLISDSDGKGEFFNINNAGYEMVESNRLPG